MPAGSGFRSARNTSLPSSTRHVPERETVNWHKRQVASGFTTSRVSLSVLTALHCYPFLLAHDESCHDVNGSSVSTPMCTGNPGELSTEVAMDPASAFVASRASC